MEPPGVMETVDGQKESVNPQLQVPRQSSRNFDTKIVMLINRRMPTEEHDLC